MRTFTDIIRYMNDADLASGKYPNLPDIDGYEIARRMRGSGIAHLLYVPIIAITANALKGDAEKALEAGCDVYMSKPINIRELWARVEGLLEATRGIKSQHS